MTDFEVYSKVYGMFLIPNKVLIGKKYSTFEYQPRSLFTETSVVFQFAHLTNNHELSLQWCHHCLSAELLATVLNIETFISVEKLLNITIYAH